MKPNDGRFGKDKSKNIVGQRFGRLVVVARIPKPEGSKARDANWLCKCDCGNEAHVRTRALLIGTKSCGCLNRENQARLLPLYRTKHGMYGTKEHRAWRKMKERCENPETDSYPYYGGRGITVCERWRNSFESFLADVGWSPSPRHSIDRIDSNGNYAPGNVRWATRQEQSRNRRDRALITFDGQTKMLVDWADETGIGIATLHDRLYNHRWGIDRAMTTDPKAYHHRK